MFRLRKGGEDRNLADFGDFPELREDIQTWDFAGILPGPPEAKTDHP
jgi:hypothetical protein